MAGGGGDWLLPKDLSCFVSENGFVLSKKSRKSQGIFFLITGNPNKIT